MKVFVIIVTYNGKQWYDQCFLSLRKSTISVQTIVIDNASTDGSVDYIHEHFPEVVLIANKENVGFGRANNQGLRYALDHECDYVFLLNQDTMIKPDTLSVMMPIMEQHPECGIFSPMHIKADEKSLYIEIEDGKTDHANALLSDCYFQSLKDIYYFRYINAAAWIIPRSTIEMLGGFDPIFFVYGEDDNYLQRLEYHKLKVGLIPKAQIIHDHIEHTHSIEYTAYRYWQTRLTQYLNINMPFNPTAIRRKYFGKMINALLHCDNRKYRLYCQELKFLKDNIDDILKSREINNRKAINWLN